MFSTFSFLLKFLFLSCIAAFVNFSTTFAQGDIGGYTPPSGLPKTDTNIADILDQTANAILSVAGMIAVVMLIIGGIQYALAAGDDEQQSRAKRTLKWTVFGMVLALLAYTITFAIAKVLG